MIKKATYKNFKCLRDAELNFVDGVNIISGSSDKGKTTAIKGILWATFNQPQGNQSVTHGEKENQVTVEIDGNKITRGIDERNFYNLNGERFTAFRNSVPNPIQSIAKISDINIQNRRDLPFMISEKSGDAAARFSTMLDLEEIGTSLANIDSEVNAVNKEKKQKEDEIKELQDKVKALDWVNEADTILQEIEQIEEKIKKDELQLNICVSIYNRFRDEYNIFVKLKSVTDAIEELKNIDVTFNNLQSCISKYNSCQSAQERYIKLNNEICKYKNIIPAKDELDSIFNLYEEFNSGNTELNNCNKLYSAFVTAQEKVDKLKIVELADTELQDIISSFNIYTEALNKLNRIANNEQQYQSSIKTSEEAQSLYNSLKTAYTEAFPDVCPLCESVVNK